MPMEKDYLAHHGIKGQKWGVRRYQNKDGTLTEAGKERDRSGNSFHSVEKTVKERLTNKTTEFLRKPIDISLVKVRGGLTDSEAKECSVLATKKFEEASKAEPKITKDVIRSVSKAGCKMYGLSNRLKQPTSLAAKIGSDAKEDGISFSEASSKIKDSIRYTSVSNERDFTRNYVSINRTLEESGYSQLRCKNYFESYYNGTSMHKAVQCTYSSPNGDIFELQFQTVASQAAKELKTPIYEERRKTGISKTRAAELESQMKELADRVSDPPGVFSIGKGER